MYAKAVKPRKTLPIMYQCQNCEDMFAVRDSASHCPYCFSNDRTNLIILHMEEDNDRAEWLDMIEYSAGD